MDYFLKQYKEVCKEEFAKYGFKTYRNNHYRVINDVFQSFNLHRSIYGHGATIEFCTLPLCYDIIIKKESCSSDHLKKFEGNYSWFEYERTEGKMEKCIDEMMIYMHKYVIPFFENGNDCRSAYNELCKFEKLARMDDIVPVHINIKVMMMLKISDRNMFLHYANAALDVIKDEYKPELFALIEHVVAGDKEYVNNYINEQEAKNLKSLSWKIK